MLDEATKVEAINAIMRAIQARADSWCPCCEYCGVWPPSSRMEEDFRAFLVDALNSSQT